MDQFLLSSTFNCIMIFIRIIKFLFSLLLLLFLFQFLFFHAKAHSLLKQITLRCVEHTHKAYLYRKTTHDTQHNNILNWNLADRKSPQLVFLSHCLLLDQKVLFDQKRFFKCMFICFCATNTRRYMHLREYYGWRWHYKSGFLCFLNNICFFLCSLSFVYMIMRDILEEDKK